MTNTTPVPENKPDNGKAAKDFVDPQVIFEFALPDRQRSAFIVAFGDPLALKEHPTSAHLFDAFIESPADCASGNTVAYIKNKTTRTISAIIAVFITAGLIVPALDFKRFSFFIIGVHPV